MAQQSKVQRRFKGKKIDLCIVIDATASMDSWVRKVKEDIFKLIHQAQEEWNLKMNLALVAYRDWETGDITTARVQHLEVLDFTDKLETFTAFVDQLIADGGNDACEVWVFLPSLPVFALANILNILTLFPFSANTQHKGRLGRLSGDQVVKLDVESQAYIPHSGRTPPRCRVEFFLFCLSFFLSFLRRPCIAKPTKTHKDTMNYTICYTQRRAK